MAIGPGTYDMTIQRRSDHNVPFSFKSGGSAVNLTGYSIASQVWDSTRTIKSADATISITNTTGGLFTWKLTDTQTATLTSDEYKYDILVTDGSGNKEYWVEGTIYMSQGYTA